MSNIGLKTVVKGDLKAAIEKVTSSLKKQGFGVLTSIDISATLKSKINQDFRPYVILGACNPGFAHRALIADENVGLLLPCNVVVEQKEKDRCDITIMNPMLMMNFLDNPKLQDLGKEAYQQLSYVITDLNESGSKSKM